MIPIPKVKGTNKSENFRAITLGSVILKLFDIVVLEYYENELMSCELQFGFKSNSSTTLCTLMVQEAISYYNYNGSDVHCVLLDASKAFDRVEYCKLFELLLQRKICPLIVRFLLFMYLHQKLCVQWDSSSSPSFSVANGVKQGAILSPILYCVYTDNLLLKLRESDVGCHLGGNFCGAFAYADDLVLLCPSAGGMKEL